MHPNDGYTPDKYRWFEKILKKKNYLSILNNHQSIIAKFILNLTNIMMINQKKLNRLLNNIILFQDISCFGSS